MPRTITPDLLAHLARPVLTLALCVLITRQDGTALGFTSLDHRLTVDGQEYEPTGSLDPSAVKNSLGTGADNLDVVGLLDSDRITEADLLAGRYDGATVELFLVNWRAPNAGRLVLLRGQIGDVTVEDGAYKAELRSTAGRMLQQVGELTSPTCRVAALGDARCKVALAGFQHIRQVAAWDAGTPGAVTFGADLQATGYYDYGRVLFTSGANAGLQREIKRHTAAAGSAVLQLQEPFPFAIVVGDTATLEAGCDRRFATCVEKFDNAVNFRGEPHIPGNGLLMKRGRK